MKYYLASSSDGNLLFFFLAVAIAITNLKFKEFNDPFCYLLWVLLDMYF